VDAQEAAAQGADAIGLVFYPPSPRAVTAVQAVQVVKTLPPFVTVVGLFVNATREEIRVVLSQTRIDMLQFHGDEKPADCWPRTSLYQGVANASGIGSSLHVRTVCRGRWAAVG